jgi:hypothetical protein
MMNIEKYFLVEFMYSKWYINQSDITSERVPVRVKNSLHYEPCTEDRFGNNSQGLYDLGMV